MKRFGPTHFVRIHSVELNYALIDIFLQIPYLRLTPNSREAWREANEPKMAKIAVV